MQSRLWYEIGDWLKCFFTNYKDLADKGIAADLSVNGSMHK